MKEADQYLKELAEVGEVKIDIRELLEAIIKEVGGMGELAEEVASLIKGSAPDSVKARMMCAMLELCNKLTPEGDDDDLPDDPEQLKAIAKEAMRKHAAAGPE